MPWTGSHTLYIHINVFLKEFCGVAKVAIGHGKILEGLIITFFYILIWMMNVLYTRRTNTQLVSQGADGAANHVYVRGRRRAIICVRTQEEIEREREEDSGLIWTAWWHNWRHRRSIWTSAGSGRTTDEWFECDGTSFSASVSIANGVFLIYFWNSWFRNFGDFFQNFRIYT